MNKLDKIIEILWNLDEEVWVFALFMLPYFIIGCYVFGSILMGLF